MPRIEEARVGVRDDWRWDAVAARDGTRDGTFYYSVATTGVYCRPSCSARLPRRSNVRFHATCEEAEAAGFRPCKRCRPKEAPQRERDVERITRACRRIETAEWPPSLSDLAASAGLSPYHFHRLFVRVVGVTPKAYAVAYRQRRLRGSLARARTVTDAIQGAGFGSAGRFYAISDEVLGMTPKEFRSGGKDAGIRFAVGECALGAILVAQSAKGICAISLGDDPEFLVRELQKQFPRAALIGGDREFESVVAKVVGLVERPEDRVDLPLDIRGTAFQHRVWDALRRIPPGETVSYAELARRIGRPRAVRAVAGACAANVIAVAIPCHRVVRNDGEPSGYRWGVDRKRALLLKEAKSRPA